MNYFKEVLNYYFRNFIYMIVYCIVPVVFISLLLHPFSMFEFLVQYPDLTLRNFGEYYWAIYGIEWLDLLWITIGFILLVVSMSLLLGFVESNLKTGKKSFSNEFSLNSNILVVSKVVISLCVAVYLLNIVMMVLMFLIHIIFANNGVGNVASTILNYVIVLSGMWLVMRSFTLLTQTGIGMMMNGSPFNVSFSDANRAIGRNSLQIFAIESSLLIVVFALVTGFTALGLTWLGNMLAMIVFLPIACILGMMIFCDVNDIKRYDKRLLYVKF